MKIESIQNERVKNWCKLKEKKYRDITNTFLIEGEHLLEEALKYSIVKEIITTENKEYDGILTYHVPKEVMAKLTEQVTLPNVIAVCEKMKSKEITGPVLLLDGIQDPGNLGTILRSAVAFSIPNILLTDSCVDLYNSKVIRSTEGMLFPLNVIRGEIESLLKDLKQKGYTIFGTDVSQGSEIEKINFSCNSVFIIGNEGKGMSLVARGYCDAFLYLPMNPACESLNASVCASIIMYEYSKKRGHYE